MSLTSGFIASLPTQRKLHPYSDEDDDYTSPRLQVTSLHDNPGVSELKESLKEDLPDVPIKSTHGLQWLTVSDGNYSISAVLNPDLKPLVESGQLKKNSIIEVDGYVLEDNPTEAAKGRTCLLSVGAITITHPDFPDLIGEPKDIFDATRAGPVNHIAVPEHPLLHLTPRSVEAIEQGTAGQVYTAPVPLKVQITEIDKINPGTWLIRIFDGSRTFKASMSKNLEMEKYGIQGHLKNNLAPIMSEEMVKVGDIISVPQYCIVGRGENRMMGLYNISVFHRT